nr:MAG TPA: helix-turn-helix domain protein [Caudoviricetes sp.]
MSTRIKEARQTAGLTQKRMSELLLIPLRTIENWESGKRNPPIWAENLIVEKLQMMSQEK